MKDFVSAVLSLFDANQAIWQRYVIRHFDRHIVWTDKLGIIHDSTIDTLKEDLKEFERNYLHSI